MTTQYKNLINGELVDNGKWIDVVNPATEQVIGQVPDCGQADLDKAVAAARAAFQTWKKTSVEERRALFAKMADVIKANSDELMRLLTSEQGKPHMQAGSEIAGCVGMTRALPMLNLEEKITEDRQAPQPYAPRSCWRGWRHRAMEFPGIDGDPENCPGAFVGLHHGAEAFTIHAAGDLAPRGTGCGRIPTRRFEHHHRWRRVGPIADLAS